MWEFEGRVQNGHLSLILKWGSIIAQFVQQDPQCPDIALLVNWLFPVDIDHFRTAVLKSCMTLNIVLNQAALGSIRGRWPWRSSGPEIA